MAFDKPTRNRLASFVSDARGVIAEEFTRQFQSLYGISEKGNITPLSQLTHLDDVGLATAALLRQRIDYLIRTHPDDKDGTAAAVDRLAREQAFTILNRLAAIRMAEKRGIIVESVGKGYQSKGFKVFEQVAGSGLGDAYHRYRRYLFCLFDEIAVDLGLFDRRSPQGLLFPGEPALQEFLSLLNASDLDELWAEDETIGWIYQNYNDPAERKRMRAASAAPRDSRELAVRNQFFTPRYVVEFLTDNTLGRIWYEMRGGQTRLKDQCRYLVRRPTEIFLKPGEAAPESSDQDGLNQEELLKQPIYITHRTMKDPREIRLLDPACGSMHFGLYAFDLFEIIYEEAWDLGLESLRRDFPDKGVFLREVPRLIIENNIHGIDIDPRAVQIAGLSLWLRAQKSWQAQLVPASLRPRMIRSNIVCAEPMPGSVDLLKEFSAALDPPLLGQLVEKVFEHMQLAGEAGSLLKIEEDIATLVKDAKKLWQSHPRAEQLKMGFALEAKPKQGNVPLDISGISDEQFWETAEERIYAALRTYAEKTEFDGYQRRLFAEDAVRGFGFIDLCRKRYDAVVMNPPFGPSAEAAVTYLNSTFPHSKHDLALCAIDRTRCMLTSVGMLGAIITRTPLFLPTSFQWRVGNLLGQFGELQVLADFGVGVLDATVESAAFAIRRVNNGRDTDKMVLFVRAVESEKKAENLLDTIGSFFSGRVIKPGYFVSLEDFYAIPFAPLSYWTPVSIRAVFRRFKPFQTDQRDAKCGLGTLDDFRFLRLGWELSPKQHASHSSAWVNYADGGSFTPFYESASSVVNWKDDGKEVKAFVTQKVGSASRKVQGAGFYFQSGLTFPRRTKRFCPRPLPKDSIFSTAGQGVFLTYKDEVLAALGLMSSDVCKYLISLSLGTNSQDQGGTNPQFEVGIVKRLPWPTNVQSTDLGRIAEACTMRKMAFESAFEDSRLFYYPLLKSFQIVTLAQHAADFSASAKMLSGFLREAVDQLNEIAASLYGISPKDLIALKAELGANDDTNILAPDPVELSQSLISWAMGTTLGRWDIRSTTGERQPPALPDPFAPLPVCPPGMLQNADRLPAEPTDVPPNYPLRISWPGILVDDENHAEDIVARVEDALKLIGKDRWEAIEHETCELLGVKTPRDYFFRPVRFFADHLKRYSKNRRQAPIYWPLSTAKGNYTLWIYYHRLTDQTLHTALADFVDPKLKSIRAETSSLRESGNHRNKLEEMQDLERELEDFRTEIERIIKLPWKPNLNDGVLITASPLWRLFRLPKWQKDLKACWEMLEKGEYDWAHLAYSIWPDRVKEVCKYDRSIAIAHNLEHLCKIEPPKTKARRGKKKPTGE